MRISVLVVLLAATLLLLLLPTLCKSDSEDESEGLNLSLGLGQRLETQDAASFGSPSTVAPGSVRRRAGFTLHELQQLGHVAAPPSSHEIQTLRRNQEAAALTEASSSMSAAAGQEAIPRMEYRFAPLSWRRYAFKYLDKPIPPFATDGHFHPQHAIDFQQRVLDLNVAKRDIVRRHKALFNTDFRVAPRVRFNNWAKLAKELSPDGAIVPLTTHVRISADDDIARMSRVENTLRRAYQ